MDTINFIKWNEKHLQGLDISNIDISYVIYSTFQQLKAIALSAFSYTNELSDYSNIIEEMIFNYGICPIIELDGVIAPIDGFTLTEPSPFITSSTPNLYSKLIYANPIVGQSTTDLVIDRDVFLIWNDSSASQISSQVINSAILLGHNFKSIEMATINRRSMNVFRTANSVQKTGVENFFKQLIKGSYAVIDAGEKGIFDDMQSYPISNDNSKDLQELMLARNNELRYICRMLLSPLSKDKNQAVLSDETEQDNEIIKALLQDRLKQRQNAISKINKKWGTNIQVEVRKDLQELLKDKKEEVKKDDSIEE